MIGRGGLGSIRAGLTFPNFSMRFSSEFGLVNIGSRRLDDLVRPRGDERNGIGAIRTGETFCRFDITSLRRFIGTGYLTCNRVLERADDEIPVVVVIPAKYGHTDILAWSCSFCGGIDMLFPRRAAAIGEVAKIIPNPCPARNAPARIAVRLRAKGEMALAPGFRHGVRGWQLDRGCSADNARDER